MARLFGLIGNRSDLSGRLLQACSEVLEVANHSGDPLGWGLGFFQSGEVLLRRRPSDDRPIVNLAESAAHLRTDLMIGHIRQPRVGSLRTENTQPFRYRMWLFAQTGTVMGFAGLEPRLVASLPEFLRRNIRGETDAELCFYLFLSFLHDAGLLDQPRVPADGVRSALRAAIALTDQLSAEEGHGPNVGEVVVSNGEHLVAVHRGGRLGLQEVSGKRAVEELLGPDSRAAPIANADQTHYTLIASELDALPTGWTSVERRVIVTATRDAPPQIEDL